MENEYKELVKKYYNEVKNELFIEKEKGKMPLYNNKDKIDFLEGVVNIYKKCFPDYCS